MKLPPTTLHCTHYAMWDSRGFLRFQGTPHIGDRRDPVRPMPPSIDQIQAVLTTTPSHLHDWTWLLMSESVCRNPGCGRRTGSVAVGLSAGHACLLHPLVYDDACRAWVCCGKKLGDRGCTAALHNYDGVPRQDGFLVIPEFFFYSQLVRELKREVVSHREQLAGVLLELQFPRFVDPVRVVIPAAERFQQIAEWPQPREEDTAVSATSVYEYEFEYLLPAKDRVRTVPFEPAAFIPAYDAIVTRTVLPEPFRRAMLQDGS